VANEDVLNEVKKKMVNKIKNCKNEGNEVKIEGNLKKS